MQLHALILAGGLGKRLRSVVKDRPKAMALIAGRPFLEYQIGFIKAQGIDHIVLCVGYLKEKIQRYFNHGQSWGVTISYAVEDNLLGTAGAIKNAEQYIRSRFVVMNGDSYFNIDLKEFVKFHEQKKSENDHLMGSIALVEVADRRNFGSVALDSNLNIVAFEEKSNRQKSPGLINAGIYLLEPDVLKRIPFSENVSLEKKIFPSLLQKGFCLAGYQADGFFVDIGTSDGFFRFQEFIRENKNDY
jgi:NDP-sugar pyrophosphorylase family protein